MMSKKFNSDILKVTDGFICHQVNCQGVMGAGLALQVKKKWPDVYQQYINHSAPEMLGQIQCIDVAENLVVVNMFAQLSYGRMGRYTNYEAFASCLEQLRTVQHDVAIHFPIGIGCGHGGANWDIINEMITQILGDKHRVFLHQL